MRGSDTVRRVGTTVSLIIGVLVLATTTLTASPAAADTTIGGDRLAARGLIIDIPPGALLPPKISAAAFVLADLDTGQIIAAQNPHRRLRPASTQKMLTALTLLPRLEKNDTYVAQYSDVAQDGSSVGLVEGHRYTINQLFLGMLLPSGNDAAHALAMAAGGVPRTRSLMMAEARRLQALDTRVVNSSGLDEPGQFSSAYDLALFARAGMARTDFRRYVGMRIADFPGENRRETYQIQNQNKLLGKFAGTIGVKTGYTTLARNTFAVAVTRNGRTLLLTLMRSDGGIREDAKAMLEWGFANADLATPVGQLVEPVPPGGVATPTATPSRSAAREQVELAPAFPFAGFAAPAAAGAGGVVVVSGLTAFGVRRRRQRRRFKAELAYRAAGFSTIAYVPPPGPLVARIPSAPTEYGYDRPSPPRPGPNGHGRPGVEPEPDEHPDDLEPPASAYPDHGRRLDVRGRPPGPPPGPPGPPRPPGPPSRYPARQPRPDQYR